MYAHVITDENNLILWYQFFMSYSANAFISFYFLGRPVFLNVCLLVIRFTPM